MDTLPVFPAAAAALPPSAWRPPEALVPCDAHRRPDPGIDNDDDEETERPIGDPDDDEGVDEDDDDDEEPLQV